MAAYLKVMVHCRFARGGFSHERKFLIPAPGGGHYVGTAYIGYCHNENGASLGPDEPPPGQQVDGLLVARVVKRSAIAVTIAVPDGGVCDVDPQLIVEDKHHVSVEP